MATSTDADDKHMTICPACGYPSAGLCAACIQISPGVPLVRAMNTVAGVSAVDPAA